MQKKYRKYKSKSFENENGKTMVLSKCPIYGIKKSRLNKKERPIGILSSLGLKTPLSKVPLLGEIFF